MTLSDLSIRKPVFAWMLMLGLIVFGMISFFRMGISQLPDVDFPVITISSSWVGAAPETMETAVADVIEDSIMNIQGIRSVSSVCQEGLATTSIEFDLAHNIDVALQEVQTKIAQAQKNLPTDIDPPIVLKSNPEDQPIVWAALVGGTTLRERVLFARDFLKDKLTTVTGVGDVRLGGYVDPNLRIWLDAPKMKERQISVDDVIAAIQSGSTLSPSGYLQSGPKETSLRVLSEASTAEQFSQIPISARNGQPIWSQIRIGDIAQVEEGLADIRRISRLNGQPAVGLGIIKQRGSNAVTIAEEVKAQIQKLKTLLPPSMDLKFVIDSTQFIKESTKELIFTLSLAAGLTSLVCWLFLGSFSSALNVILAIPTSLIGSFIILSFFGFTLNTFTLLALSLSIGIVVDDAILVLENIVRYHEQGMSRVKAALLGAREITGAAFAATLAILAIFIPVIFMKGIIGKFFYQFGIAMSAAVALSLLEALTLAPMRCSQFLRSSHSSASTPGIFQNISQQVNRGLDRLTQRYTQLLERCLRHRWKVILASFSIFFASLFLLSGVRKEFVPPQDQSRFLVTIQTPLGSSLQFTDQVFQKAEAFLKERPEVDSFFVALGGFQGGLVNLGNMFVTLKPVSDRPFAPPFKHSPSQQEFMTFARDFFKKIEGTTKATVIDLSLSGFTSSRGFPVQFSVQGPDWSQLASLSRKFMDRMSQSGLMTDVDTDYYPNMPEIRILPDRAKAALRGVSTKTISSTLSSLVGGQRVGKYTDASGHRSDVRIKLAEKYSQTPEDLTQIWVRNNRGEMVPLSQVVTYENQSSLLTLNRYNRERAIALFANVLPGQSQAVAMDFVEKTAKEILPPGYHWVLSGSSQAFKESFQSLIMALVLGIFVAYMVLGAQFNSFIHPFTVLLALPFSVTGAFIALRLAGVSLNIYSMIGILLLMGIVKKNSILLVDFTNHRRKQGHSVSKALLEACPLRLRPILMTSIATVVAAIPAALSLGPGGEVTRPMAVVVIGGVIFSTALTLIVVPCAYSLLAPLEGQKHQKELEEALATLSPG